MEDKLRELISKVIVNERNIFVELQKKELADTLPEDIEEVKMKFLSNLFMEFEYRYDTIELAPIRKLATEFIPFYKKYATKNVSEILALAKSEFRKYWITQKNWIEDNYEERIGKEDEWIIFEIAIYYAWEQMHKSYRYYNGDIYEEFREHKFSPLPSEKTELVTSPLFEQLYKMRTTFEKNPELAVIATKSIEEKSLIIIYSRLYSTLSSKENDFFKPLICEIKEEQFIAILLNPKLSEIKIHWIETLNILIYFLDSLAKLNLLITAHILQDDREPNYASNNFIVGHFIYKGRECKPQSIYNARTANDDRKNLPKFTLIKLDKINSIISSAQKALTEK